MGLLAPPVNQEHQDATSSGAHHRTSGRARIIRNVSALGAGQLLTWACTAGMAVLLPRYIDPDGLGKLATAASLTSLFGLIAGLGVSTYLTKEVGRRGADARAEVLNALVMRVPLIVIACAAAVIVAHLLGYEPLTLRLIYLSCASIAIAAVGGVLVGALQGLQQMPTIAFSGVLFKATTLGLALAVVFWDFGLVGLVVSGLVAGTVSLAWNVVSLVRCNGIGGTIDLRTWRPILTGSLPFFVWQAALMIYGQVDIILLSVMTNDAVVGWYAAAYRVVSIPVFIPTIVAGAIFPALAWTARHDAVEFTALARRSLHVILLLTIPMALGTMATADRIVQFLDFPQEFRNAVPSMIILAAHMPMVGVSMVVGHILNARDQQKLWIVTGIAAAALNPGIDSWLIPYFEATYANGGIGSAIGTVLTEFFMLGIGVWLVRKPVCDAAILLYACKCLTVGLVMVGVVIILHDLPLPLIVAAGAAAYAVGSIAVGSVTMQDAILVRGYLLKRTHTAAANR